MTTLATLKDEIVSDLDDRSDLTDEIASAITAAINHYKPDRFYFNERRSTTFSTVAAQQNYGSADSSDIPNMVNIDLVHITISGQRYDLRRRNHMDLELLYDNAAMSGQPFEFSYYNREFWLYPVPNDAYTIRVLGLIKIGAPASDAEADNPWMTEAYELIRCRAKAYLAAHKLRDPEMAQVMQAAEYDALGRLRKETALRLGTGRFVPTCF